MSDARRTHPSEHHKLLTRPAPIDYNRFKNDRRISRPPGVPTLWSRPTNQTNRTLSLPSSSPIPPAADSKLLDIPPSKPSSSYNRKSEDSPKDLDSPAYEVKTQALTAPVIKSLSQPAKEVECRTAANPTKREKIPNEIRTTSKSKKKTAEDIRKPYPLRNSPSSSKTQTQENRQEIKTMTIEQLELRHRQALKKFQQRFEETQTQGTIDKDRLRKKYEEEIDQLRTQMKLDEANGRSRTKGSEDKPKNLISYSRSDSKPAHELPQQGSSKNFDSSNQNTLPHTPNQSRRTWLNY